MIALMNVVVHQPRVARERNPLAAGDEISLVHHAVLKIAQLVGRRAEQIDQYLIEIGLACHLPAGHALHHRGDQGVAERIVVLGEIVDRRPRPRRLPRRPLRRAVVGEAAGTKFEPDLAQQRIDRRMDDL